MPHRHNTKHILGHSDLSFASPNIEYEQVTKRENLARLHDPQEGSKRTYREEPRVKGITPDEHDPENGLRNPTSCDSKY